MQRQCANVRDTFPRSIEAYTSELEPALRHRRAELDARWTELEQGWKGIEERRADIGVRPRTDKEGMLSINVGGSITRLSVSLLAEAGLFEDGNALGGLLEGIWENKNVPRDAAGRVVLDESGVFVKHIIQTMLNKRSSSVAATSGLETGALPTLSPNEHRQLMYTSYVLGTARQAMRSSFKATHIVLRGGSTILTPLELVPMSATLHRWCNEENREQAEGQMDLIYRASRDGFDAKAFRAKCLAEIVETITLIRVGNDGAAGHGSIVGGYSWEGDRRSAAKAFVFMLRDGTCASPNTVTSVKKWSVNCCRSNPGPSPVRSAAGRASAAVRESAGPRFGKDLRVNFDERGGGTIQIGEPGHECPDDPAFRGHNGNQVVDIEVFGACSVRRLGKKRKLSGGTANSSGTADDTRSFGEAIAGSLAEERLALQIAFKAMAGAEARVAAASEALRTVYGPDLEAHKKDFVVELNVRGTVMTTLRSTLQACPESALAARFDEEKWPVAKTDCDEQGRRLIDCRPSVFSKVLDALRMRKRESWSLSKARKESGWRGEARVVVVQEDDRACLGEFVDMYFPGCTSFIMDLVVLAGPEARTRRRSPSPPSSSWDDDASDDEPSPGRSRMRYPR